MKRVNLIEINVKINTTVNLYTYERGNLLVKEYTLEFVKVE